MFISKETLALVGLSALLFVILTLLIFLSLRRAMGPVRSRLRIQSLAVYKGGVNRTWLLRLLRIPTDRDRRDEYRQLLEGIGVQWRCETYWIWQRIVQSVSVFLLVAAGLLWDESGLRFNTTTVMLLTALMTVLLLSLFDKPWLEAIGNYRRLKITKEVFAIGHQLLYYTGARMNLHAKLTRCIPFTRLLRRNFLLLLQEWYEDPEEALVRFKHRTGTDEAYSFAETLNILRMSEDETYYELLRRRIRDFKEKLDMVRESRKESFSYVLFILAGIPILNTFRVFMHPWVEEGRKLFESLNF